jgi:inosine/xanthosine triphosphate pyrophosphatase family protein
LAYRYGNKKRGINMKQILFATENPSKAKRFSKGLLEKGIEVITINDISNKVEVEENGKDAIQNALIKARAYSNIVNIPVIAMDDNLYIESIPEEKQPGMYVRRVNGKRLDDDEMIEYYSLLAKEYGQNGKLTCRWIYGIAVLSNGKENTYTWSKEDFYIVDKPSDKINPGYPLNTISINKKLNKYFTDITEEDRMQLQEDESDVVEFIYKNI